VQAILFAKSQSGKEGICTLLCALTGGYLAGVILRAGIFFDQLDHLPSLLILIPIRQALNRRLVHTADYPSQIVGCIGEILC
jgi:hypothetical protein